MNKPKTIPMSPVKSSQIAEIGHDGTTLAIKFKSGQTYHYHDVSQTKFDAMKKAESIGAFFAKNIRPAHKFTKLEAK